MNFLASINEVAGFRILDELLSIVSALRGLKLPKDLPKGDSEAALELRHVVADLVAQFAY